MKLFFSDVDNTLVFKKYSDIKIHGEPRYISSQTIDLIKKIKDEIPFVIITGRRITGFERLKKIPYTFGIIEHGCLIVKNGNFDKHYAKDFKEYIGKPWRKKKKGILWDYEKKWIDAGYTTDSKNRYASFRIDPDKNHLNHHEIKEILSLKHPKDIKIVRNGRYIDFIPPMGGKSHAINYLLHKEHARWKHVGAFGDDYNDLEMLISVKFPFTHSGAVHEIKKTVKYNKGYISPYNCHEASADVLKKVLSNLRNN